MNREIFEELKLIVQAMPSALKAMITLTTIGSSSCSFFAQKPQRITSLRPHPVKTRETNESYRNSSQTSSKTSNQQATELGGFHNPAEVTRSNPAISSSINHESDKATANSSNNNSGGSITPLSSTPLNSGTPESSAHQVHAMQIEPAKAPTAKPQAESGKKPPIEKLIEKLPSAISKKVRSFTLDPPPALPVYDLTGPENWFASRMGSSKEKVASNHDDISLKSPLSVKIAKLAPVVILYKANSPLKSSFEKLELAIKSHFMPCECLIDSEQVRERLLDASATHRLRLTLIESELAPVKGLGEDSIVIAPTSLTDPNQKYQLWLAIQKRLGA